MVCAVLSKKHKVWTYTPIYINHTITVCMYWPNISSSARLCTIYNRTHQADNSAHQRRLCVVLNDLIWIHRTLRSGHSGRCTCWVWSRSHLHMCCGRLLQRGTEHSFKQHPTRCWIEQLSNARYGVLIVRRLSVCCRYI